MSRDSRSTPPGFWIIWLTVATHLVGFGIVLPLLPLFAKEFGAGPLVATTLVASYSAAQFAAAPSPRAPTWCGCCSLVASSTAWLASGIGYVLLAIDGRRVSLGAALAFLVVGQGLFTPTLSSPTSPQCW